MPDSGYKNKNKARQLGTLKQFDRKKMNKAPVPEKIPERSGHDQLSSHRDVSFANTPNLSCLRNRVRQICRVLRIEYDRIRSDGLL